MDRIYETHSWVITRKKFEIVDHTTYGEISKLGAKLFTLKALLMARNYDIIHVHAFDKMIPYLKLIYPRKKIFLHYRGADIRGIWDIKFKYWSKADQIFVSTEDLLDGAPSGTMHIPRAVDTDFFYPRGTSNPGTAFSIPYMADDLALKYAEENDLVLIFGGGLETPIKYTKFSEVLSKYEYYIDVKRSKGKILEALSKTGLESLACGLKVIKWNGEIVNGFPEKNHPERVVEKLYSIYLEVLS